MMLLRAALVALLILSGCASNAYFDRDHANPLYHTGGSVVFRPILPYQAKLVAQSTLSTYREYKAGATPIEQAVLMGGLASGVSLVLNRDYYKSSYIGGRFACKPALENSFEVPCGNITVILEDLSGREISQIQASDDEFVFLVEKGKEYRVRIASNRYQLPSKSSPALMMGDNIVLHLVQKKSESYSE